MIRFSILQLWGGINSEYDCMYSRGHGIDDSFNETCPHARHELPVFCFLFEFMCAGLQVLMQRLQLQKHRLKLCYTLHMSVERRCNGILRCRDVRLN